VEGDWRSTEERSYGAVFSLRLPMGESSKCRRQSRPFAAMRIWLIAASYASGVCCLAAAFRRREQHKRPRVSKNSLKNLRTVETIAFRDLQYSVMHDIM